MNNKNNHNSKKKTVFLLKADELEILIKSTFEYNSDEDLLFSMYEHKGKMIALFGISYLMDTGNGNRKRNGRLI